MWPNKIKMYEEKSKHVVLGSRKWFWPILSHDAKACKRHKKKLNKYDLTTMKNVRKKYYMALVPCFWLASHNNNWMWEIYLRVTCLNIVRVAFICLVINRCYVYSKDLKRGHFCRNLDCICCSQIPRTNPFFTLTWHQKMENYSFIWDNFHIITCVGNFIFGEVFFRVALQE